MWNFGSRPGLFSENGMDDLIIIHRSTTVLDRAGHALGVEQESLFRTLIREWLDRVETELDL